MTQFFTLSRKRYSFITLLLTSFILIPILYSCEDEVQSMTYVNGKIVNPKSDYIVITDYADVRDTLLLDEKGNFKMSYDQIKSGLFTISYPGEYQSFYLDQGDSLGMRANTKAFDETLAFTGSHARENTYLINLFGEIEDSNMNLIQRKNESPQDFYNSVQKIRKERLKDLKTATKKYKFNERFVEFAEFIIKLNSYYELERYPIIYAGNIYNDDSITFPKEFFAHRSRIDVDKPKLLNNYAFRPFMNALISNIAYKKSSQKNDKEINLNSYTYNKSRLLIIDSIFEEPVLKNYFATTEIREFVRRRNNAEDINLLVSDFLDISTDQKANDEIAQLAATYINLGPGNPLPDFQLRDVDNEIVKLKGKLNKLTVLYYWSTADRNYALGIHDQVKDLQLKYPEIEFIGINIDNMSYDNWQDAIANNDFRDSREFQIYGESAINRELALRNSNRSMVIDKNLTIIDPNINLFYYKIETTLLGYLNR